MLEIALSNLKKSFGATTILQNISLEINTGEKVGLIGRNGTGKTTLFKIMAGMEPYDEGFLTIRKGASIGYLSQIPSFLKNCTVLDVLHTAFQEQFALREELQKLEQQMSLITGENLDEIMKKYSEVQQHFEHIGGYEIETNLQRICLGLKIAETYKKREFATLSGGEKTVVMIATILLQRPEILLLDEPSNHLDIDAVEWLESFLQEYKGTVVVISHDRYFLERIAQKIIELEDGEAQAYLGNYSFYLKEHERRLMAEFEAYEDQQKKIKAMEKAIQTYHDWGNRADNVKFHRKAASLQKRLDKIEVMQRPILERQKIKLGLTSSGRSGKDVLTMKNLSKKFSEKSILHQLDFHMRYGEKIALIGSNGCGKSTLFKLIINEYTPDQGEIKVGTNVTLGYLPQEITFADEEKTVLETFRADFIMNEETARGLLAKFLFFGEDVFKKVKDLSGGEKTRLRLCQLIHNEINMLLLDEPTNHLDIDAKETLEEALSQFTGSLLFISHDRYFINKIAQRVVELSSHQLISYPGDYDYYRQKKLEKVFVQEPKAKRSLSEAQLKYLQIKQTATEAKKRATRIKRLEEKIEIAEKNLTQLNEMMSQYNYDHEKLHQLYQEKNAIQTELDKLMEAWLIDTENED